MKSEIISFSISLSAASNQRGEITNQKALIRNSTRVDKHPLHNKLIEITCILKFPCNNITTYTRKQIAEKYRPFRGEKALK